MEAEWGSFLLMTGIWLANTCICAVLFVIGLVFIKLFGLVD